ncbi:42931_t:CDS:2 [Gigaspora margarita]|uniref:42931_t:CDS:1 n=1 Tax=Gigaspora margarita TaxID=4874 RepID=A0ABN7V4N8_GIGMA|nr:42931_t:CDS:2 [Gigaspora margarita]
MKDLKPIERINSSLNENIFEQLVKASFELDQLHKAGITSLHRSKNLPPKFVLSTRLAPEVLTDIYSEEALTTAASDIFAMGITMAEMTQNKGSIFDGELDVPLRIGNLLSKYEY